MPSSNLLKTVHLKEFLNFHFIAWKSSSKYWMINKIFFTLNSFSFLHLQTYYRYYKNNQFPFLILVSVCLLIYKPTQLMLLLFSSARSTIVLLSKCAPWESYLAPSTISNTHRGINIYREREEEEKRNKINQTKRHVKNYIWENFPLGPSHLNIDKYSTLWPL